MTDAQKLQKPVFDRIKIALINADPKKNSRTTIDQGKIDELALTMKREGQLQPIRVEIAPNGRFDLVFGYRRIAAAQKLGWTEIDAEIVAQMSPVDRKVANMLENMGREDLTTFDQANGFHELQKTYGMSGTSIAHSIGKSVPYVNNLIRIIEGLDTTVLERWKEECTPSFGKDPETGKRLPNVHTVCTTEWLGKLVSRVPRAEQEHELKVALGLISTDEDGNDESEGDQGGGGAKRDTDAPRRATMKQLERALEAAEAKVKELREAAKGKDQRNDELVAAQATVATLKFAMGKTQTLKAIGYTNPKPGEEPAKTDTTKKK